MSIVEQINIQQTVNYNKIFVDYLQSILNGEVQLSSNYSPQNDWICFSDYKDWQPGVIDGDHWQWFSSPTNTTYASLNSTGKTQVKFGAALLTVLKSFIKDELYSK